VDDKHLVISGSTIEYVILAYLSPPTIILGLIGNFINLLVLLSKEMRSRSTLQISQTYRNTILN
jgi:hypothetical protein